MTSRLGLVLIGPRGVGKSSIAEALSVRLGLPALDTDRLVERAAHTSVFQLFAARGEEGFRRLEREVIASVEPGEPIILATGGGAVLSPSTRAHLRRLGAVIWLTAKPSILAGRIAGSARPSLTGRPPAEEIEEIMSKREPLYRDLANWTVDTGDRTIEEVCDELEQFWRRLPSHDLR